MRTFTLLFPDDGIGEPKTIKFQSDDPLEAFAILDREKPEREVSVWEETCRLGSLTRTRSGFWTLT